MNRENDEKSENFPRCSASSDKDASLLSEREEPDDRSSCSSRCSSTPCSRARLSRSPAERRCSCREPAGPPPLPRPDFERCRVAAPQLIVVYPCGSVSVVPIAKVPTEHLPGTRIRAVGPENEVVGTRPRMKSSELVGRARGRGGWGPGWNEGGRGGILSFLCVPFSIVAPLPLPSPTVQEPRQSEPGKISGTSPFRHDFRAQQKIKFFVFFSSSTASAEVKILISTKFQSR